MATTVRRFSVHCFAQPSVYCPLKLLLLCLAFNPSPMLWGVLYQAGACIPSLCLKYLVICIANALLATGWLVVSVLSLLGELLPKVLEVPPTMPKLPSRSTRESSPPLRSRRVGGTRSQEGMPVATAAMAGVLPTGGDSVSHHAQSTVADGQAAVDFPVSRSSSYTRSNEGGASNRTETQGSTASESPDERPSPLAASALDGERRGSPEATRGRTISFLRKHLSTSRGSPKRPSTRRVSSLGSVPSSPARSPERSEHSPPCPIKECLKKTMSHESMAKVAAPRRTDPYQAPYFFPSPLSPEAVGYTSRIRSERVSSPSNERKPSMPSPLAATAALAPSPPTSQPSTSAVATSPASPEAAEKPRRRSSRKSWRMSFRQEHQEDLRRPTSWTSEATTLIGPGSTPSESTSLPPSPEMRDRKALLGHRQSSGRMLTPLSGLELSGFGDIHPSPPALVSRGKSWHFPFRHKRTGSGASSDSGSQPSSNHADDEVTKSRGRPKLHRTM